MIVVLMVIMYDCGYLLIMYGCAAGGDYVWLWC
jgi:hypothetical protein